MFKYGVVVNFCRNSSAYYSKKNLFLSQSYIDERNRTRELFNNN